MDVRDIGKGIGYFGVDGAFQGNGGLCFVVDLGANIQKGGDRIEEPAATGGHGCIDVFLDHLDDQVRFRRAQGPVEGEIQVDRLGAKALEKRGQCKPAGLADSGCAARHGHGLQPCMAVESTGVAQKYLTSPDGAVATVAGTVQDDADTGLLDTVLGQDRCQMGVVMLYGDKRKAGLSFGPFGGDVIGMEIVSDDFRFDFEDALQVPDPVFEELEGSRMVHITDMLARKDLVPTTDGENVFELAATGEDGSDGPGFEEDGSGHETACPAQDLEVVPAELDDGVVTTLKDFPVVGEKDIGQ